MRYLVFTMVAVIALAAVVTAIGYALPVAHTASREAVVAAPPAEVFAAISAVDRYPDWWPDISRVEMLSTGGKTRFRQQTGSGPLVMEVDESVPVSRFVTRIADPDQPFGGTWTFELTPAGGGTRVTLTERGEVYNPIFRFVSRFVFGQTSTIESCLRALAQRFR